MMYGNRKLLGNLCVLTILISLFSMVLFDLRDNSAGKIGEPSLVNTMGYPGASDNNSETNAINYGTDIFPCALDPQKAWDSFSIELVEQVCEGLFTYDVQDPNLSIIPILARDLGTWNPDATEYRVDLKTNVSFHDGSGFNAYDVKWTFDRMKYLVENDIITHGSSELFCPIDNEFVINQTEVLDDDTVIFHLNYPYLPFEHLLCTSLASILPDSGSIPSDRVLEIDSDTLIGTGPYEFAEYTENLIRLTAFPDYHRGWSNNKVQEIHISKISGADDRTDALIAGELDITYSINNSRWNELQNNENITVSPPFLSNTMFFLSLNNNKINQTMRQALSYAFDYDSFMNMLSNDYFVNATRLESIIPKGIQMHHSDLDFPTFNITKARQVLLDAGIVDPETYAVDNDEAWMNLFQNHPIDTYEYVYISDLLNPQLKRSTGELLAECAQKIGINISIRSYTVAEIIIQPLWQTIVPDLYLTGFSPYINDPALIINSLIGNNSDYNYAYVNDAYLNNLIESGLIETNETNRITIYQQIQEYVVEDLMPYIWLYQGILQFAYSNQIEEIEITPITQNFYFYGFKLPEISNNSDDDHQQDGIKISGFPAFMGFYGGFIILFAFGFSKKVKKKRI